MEANSNPDYDPERSAEEAAAAAGPDHADTSAEEHDPYAHLRPYQFKKGQPSANPNGRPPGIRTLARRFRQAGTLRPADIEAFKKLAAKLGIEDEVLKGMDIMDLYTMTTMLHAMQGKGPAMSQIQQAMGARIRYTPNDHKDKAQTPEDYRRSAIEFYEAIIESEDVTVAEKLAARRQLDAIQGLTRDESTMGADQLGDAIRSFLDMSEQSVPEKEVNVPSQSGEDEPPKTVEADRL